MNLVPLAAAGCGGVLLLLALWWRQQRTSDAGSADLGWVVTLGAAGIAVAIGGRGLVERRWLIGAVLAVWAVRLFWLLLSRADGVEDGRYARLRRDWGPQAGRRFFVLFQAQVVAAVLMALPIAAVAASAEPLSWRDALGALIGLLAIAGEGLADQQLRRFKGREESRGRTCREGLWRYSRHPNYFFEWVFWWGPVVMALGTPWLGVTLLGPLMMGLLLVGLTGIPPAETRALESRSDYRSYQRVTSAFVPWFPREESS